MEHMANTFRTCRALGLSVCLFGFHYLWAQSAEPGYALRGTLVTPAGIVENGTILIQQSKIVAVGAKVKLPPNATVIDTHGVIAPGLIDLHNHLTYNVFPRWHPASEFGNRYDWQQKPIYQTLIESPHASMVADGLECEMERYAEVKALSEGETSAVGSLADACSTGLRTISTAKTSGMSPTTYFPCRCPKATSPPFVRGWQTISCTPF
jgi:hypothetical protein